MKFLPTPKPPAAVDSGISQGAELAGSIVVFFLIGFALDAWLDTTPLLMIVLTVFAVIGQFVKIYFTYSREMGRLEAERAESTRGGAR